MNWKTWTENVKYTAVECLIQSAVDISDKIYFIGEAWFSLSGDVNRIADVEQVKSTHFP